MELQLWQQVYQQVLKLAKPRRKRVQFSDPWIVLVYLWAVVHDRPTCWACEARNWKNHPLPPGELPSATTMSRRLRSVGVRQFLELLEAEAISWFPLGLCYWIDSKASACGWREQGS